VRKEIEKSLRRNLTVFEPIEYAVQVVAGTNFFVKIRIGDDEYIHARIERSLPHSGNAISLDCIQAGKTLQDPLGYISH